MGTKATKVPKIFT